MNKLKGHTEVHCSLISPQKGFNLQGQLRSLVFNTDLFQSQQRIRQKFTKKNCEINSVK